MWLGAELPLGIFLFVCLFVFCFGQILVIRLDFLIEKRSFWYEKWIFGHEKFFPVVDEGSIADLELAEFGRKVWL